MNKDTYECKIELSSSIKNYLKSFIEYKVNIEGCKESSFLSFVKKFDTFCLEHEIENLSINIDLIHKFYESQLHLRKTVLKLCEKQLQSFCKYLIEVLDFSDIYVPNIVKQVENNFKPYIFSKKEIYNLFHAIDTFNSKKAMLNGAKNVINCSKCIIAMLYCTGMRISEACNLKTEDVDLDNKLIYIYHSKFDKTRVVTISQSLESYIKKYLDESSKIQLSRTFFFDTGKNKNNGQISKNTVYHYFRIFLKEANVQHNGRNFGPRLHDLRHTFAVHSLKNLTEQNVDTNNALYYLSIYLGHQSINETQNYLWLTYELFEPTLKKIECTTEFISEIFDKKIQDFENE